MTTNAIALKVTHDLKLKEAGVWIHVAGGMYVISGPSGNHELSVEGTTEERLAAHVAGYLENNGKGKTA